jgi:hypothetical protein
MEDRHQGASERLTDHGLESLLTRGSDHELSLDSSAAVHQSGRQRVEAEGDAGHAIAEKHAEYRQEIPRVVPRFGPERRCQPEQRDDHGREHHRARAKTIGPEPREATVLARSDLVPREQHHHQGNHGGQERRYEGEDGW